MYEKWNYGKSQFPGALQYFTKLFPLISWHHQHFEFLSWHASGGGVQRTVWISTFFLGTLGHEVFVVHYIVRSLTITVQSTNVEWIYLRRHQPCPPYDSPVPNNTDAKLSFSLFHDTSPFLGTKFVAFFWSVGSSPCWLSSIPQLATPLHFHIDVVGWVTWELIATTIFRVT